MNDQSLNEQQISFVKRVVDYVVENGYMEPVALTQPPFDRPCSFMQIFDQKRATALVALVKTIKQKRCLLLRNGRRGRYCGRSSSEPALDRISEAPNSVAS